MTSVLEVGTHRLLVTIDATLVLVEHTETKLSLPRVPIVRTGFSSRRRMPRSVCHVDLERTPAQEEISCVLCVSKENSLVKVRPQPVPTVLEATSSQTMVLLLVILVSQVLSHLKDKSHAPHVLEVLIKVSTTSLDASRVSLTPTVTHKEQQSVHRVKDSPSRNYRERYRVFLVQRRSTLFSKTVSTMNALHVPKMPNVMELTLLVPILGTLSISTQKRELMNLSNAWRVLV